MCPRLKKSYVPLHPPHYPVTIWKWFIVSKSVRHKPPCRLLKKLWGVQSWDWPIFEANSSRLKTTGFLGASTNLLKRLKSSIGLFIYGPVHQTAVVCDTSKWYLYIDYGEKKTVVSWSWIRSSFAEKTETKHVIFSETSCPSKERNQV